MNEYFVHLTWFNFHFNTDIFIIGNSIQTELFNHGVPYENTERWLKYIPTYLS